MSHSGHYPQLDYPQRDYPQLEYPQLDRVISRIGSLDAPVVQLWGWPGSGRAALLEALLARLGGRALALSLAVLANEEELATPTARRTLSGSRTPSVGCGRGNGW
jgi:hypothetical protein